MPALGQASGQKLTITVHTPTSSFSIFHSLTGNSLRALQSKLDERVEDRYHDEYRTKSVGKGWLKYDWNGIVYDLDTEEDYAIWLQRLSPVREPVYLHMRDPIMIGNPSRPNEYRNPHFYTYKASASGRSDGWGY